MSIELTPALEQLIHSKVQTGQYKSAVEVIETAMKILSAYDLEEADWLNGVRSKIDEAYETTEPPVDGSAAIAILRAGVQRLHEQGEISQVRLEELRRDALAGWEELRRGEGVDGATAMAEVLAYVQAKK
jgi:antitoxin ParD1/3/4